MKLYRQAPQIRTRQLGSQTVLIDIKKKDYLQNPILLHLNSTGRFIWDLLQKPRSTQEVFCVFSSCLEQGFNPHQAEKDTVNFIHRLWEMGCLIAEETGEEEKPSNGLQSH